MKRLLSLLALLLPVFAGAQSLVISHLSETHTMVKVSGKDRYVMLPVQENAPEARVKVLSNGTEVLSANVCLAIDKTDYLVPMDLSQWGGSSIILDIKMNQGRSLRRDPSDDVCAYTNRIYGIQKNCWSINTYDGEVNVENIKVSQY